MPFLLLLGTTCKLFLWLSRRTDNSRFWKLKLPLLTIVKKNVGYFEEIQWLNCSVICIFCSVNFAIFHFIVLRLEALWMISSLMQNMLLSEGCFIRSRFKFDFLDFLFSFLRLKKTKLYQSASKFKVSQIKSMTVSKSAAWCWSRLPC